MRVGGDGKKAGDFLSGCLMQYASCRNRRTYTAGKEKLFYVHRIKKREDQRDKIFLVCHGPSLRSRKEEKHKKEGSQVNC